MSVYSVFSWPCVFYLYLSAHCWSLIISQPVSLLPTTLQEYEEALPDLPREKVLTIFREVETAKSGKLSLCREVRRQIIAEEEEDELGLRRHKLSCLSPIVEHVGGRDSALGTSHSSAATTTSQHTARYLGATGQDMLTLSTLQRAQDELLAFLLLSNWDQTGSQPVVESQPSDKN